MTKASKQLKKGVIRLGGPRSGENMVGGIREELQGTTVRKMSIRWSSPGVEQLRVCR